MKTGRHLNAYFIRYSLIQEPFYHAERYQQLLQDHPEVVRMIPVKYVASYLDSAVSVATSKNNKATKLKKSCYKKRNKRSTSCNVLNK